MVLVLLTPMSEPLVVATLILKPSLLDLLTLCITLHLSLCTLTTICSETHTSRCDTLVSDEEEGRIGHIMPQRQTELA